MRLLYGFLAAVVTFTLVATSGPRASDGAPSLPPSPQIHQDNTIAYMGTLTGDVAVVTLGTHRIVVAVDTEEDGSKDGRADNLFTVDVKSAVPFPLSSLLENATVRFQKRRLSIDGSEDFEFEMVDKSEAAVNGERDSSRLVFNTVIGLAHRAGASNDVLSLVAVAAGRVPNLPPHPYDAQKAPKGGS